MYDRRRRINDMHLRIIPLTHAELLKWERKRPFLVSDLGKIKAEIPKRWHGSDSKEILLWQHALRCPIGSPHPWSNPTIVRGISAIIQLTCSQFSQRRVLGSTQYIHYRLEFGSEQMTSSNTQCRIYGTSGFEDNEKHR